MGANSNVAPRVFRCVGLRRELGAMAVEQKTTSQISMPADTAIAEFAAALRGPLIRRGDPGYADAAKVYNAMIDRHPALIARCADVADVRTAVTFARAQGLP